MRWLLPTLVNMSGTISGAVIVDRDVEEALDLAGVQLHGHSTRSAPASVDQIGHKLGQIGVRGPGLRS